MYDERAPSAPADARDRALEELLIAEGSDWFWWYGDDHSSDHDAEFDDLFRRHLRNAYAALGADIPESLFATNISTGAGPDRLEVSGLLSPVLDGRDTSFLEWVGAVAPTLARPGGAMHEVSAPTLISQVAVGLSAAGLCLRIDGQKLVELLASGRARIAIVVGGTDVRVVSVGRPWIAVRSIVEIEVPFDQLSSDVLDLPFAIQVRDDAGAILESVPHGRFWTIALPSRAPWSVGWQA